MKSNGKWLEARPVKAEKTRRDGSTEKTRCEGFTEKIWRNGSNEKTWRNGSTENTRRDRSCEMAGKILTAFLSIVITACGTSSEMNVLTPDEERDGWELVFDGKSLDGWRGLNMQDVPENHWIVEKGTLKKVARDSIPVGADGDRPSGGDLLLDRPVNNFKFAFEWKVSPVANSRIKYNVSEELSAADGNPHSALGFEYQILDDPEYPQLEDNPDWATAGLYELVAPGPNARLNPVGEWNSGKIVFDGTYGEHWLNGERVLVFDLNSPEMVSSLAASKWADIDEFAKRHENAYIIIQDHGDSVWYRNLKLKVLP